VNEVQVSKANNLQQALTQVVETIRFNALVSKASTVADAAVAIRVARCAAPRASLWLSTVPLDATLALRNDEFRYALRHMLGVAPVDDGRMCHCKKSRLVAGHYQTCTSVRYTIRHNRVVDELASLARFFNVAVKKCPATGIVNVNNPTGQAVEPDVVVEAVGGLKPLAVDVGVVYEEQKNSVKRAMRHARLPYRARVKAIANDAGEVERLEKEKAFGVDAKVGATAEEVCRQNGQDFEPFVMETHGYMGDAALRVVDRLVEHSVSTMRFEGAATRLYVMRRIAIALQRGNALLDATYLVRAPSVSMRAVGHEPTDARRRARHNRGRFRYSQ
jgi:hypothetical protein